MLDPSHPLPTPVIQITRPAENGKVTAGVKLPIEWTKNGVMSQFVNISLLYNGEMKIATNAPNNGLYMWSVPDNETVGAAYLRIATIDNKVSDTATIFVVRHEASLHPIWTHGGSGVPHKY